MRYPYTLFQRIQLANFVVTIIRKFFDKDSEHGKWRVEDRLCKYNSTLEVKLEINVR